MSIAFVKHETTESHGPPPVTSGSTIPATAGNQLLIFASTEASDALSITSAIGGAYSLVTPPGLNNDADGDEFGVFSNPTAVASAQTYVITSAGSGFVSGALVEYSGVGSLSNGAFTLRTGISSGSNILGAAVTIPTGSVLVAYCISGTSAANPITATNGTSRWQVDDGNLGFTIAEYAGTGASVTPTFTSTESPGDFSIVQIMLNPPAGASGSAAIVEGADTVSASGATSTSGTAAIVEGQDSVAGVGSAGTVTAIVAALPRPGPGISPSTRFQFSSLVRDTSPSTLIQGIAAITESSDTVAGTGAIGGSGSAAIVESADTVAGAGGLSVSGSAAITETSDTVSATGTLGVSGSAAIVESADAVAATGSVIQPASFSQLRGPGPGISPAARFQFSTLMLSTAGPSSVQGMAAITELADTVAGAGILSVTGTAAILEQADTASATGNLGGGGSGATTETPDTVSGSGILSTSGTASVVETPDIVAGVGGGLITGSAAITESPDMVAGVGTAAFSGTAAITELPDTVAATGSLATSGSAAISETPDAVVGTGSTSGGPITGSAAITETPDTATGTGGLSVAGTGAAVETPDVVSGAGGFVGIGVAAITEGPDTASGAGTASFAGVGTVTETPDIVAGSGITGGAGTVMETPDIVSGAGSIGVAGSANVIEGPDIVAGSGVPGVRFGCSTISVETCACVIIEESACFIDVNFIDESGQPFVPNSAQYRLDDVASARQILDWTPLTAPLASTMRITVTALQNKLLGRPFETHQCLVQLTDGYGDVDNVRVTWEICQVVGLPN